MQPSYAPPPPPGPPPSPIPPWARWLGLGCGALLLLGTIFGVVLATVVKRATAGPEQVVQAFLAAAAKGDYAGAHGYFSAPLKNVQPLDVFTQAATDNQQLFKVKETTFNNRSVDLTSAELSGTVTLEDDNKLPASFKLVREGGDWRLISYNIGSG